MALPKTYYVIQKHLIITRVKARKGGFTWFLLHFEWVLSLLIGGFRTDSKVGLWESVKIKAGECLLNIFQKGQGKVLYLLSKQDLSSGFLVQREMMASSLV